MHASAAEVHFGHIVPAVTSDIENVCSHAQPHGEIVPSFFEIAPLSLYRVTWNEMLISYERTPGGRTEKEHRTD